ncbi:alpha-beta hydrolase superfamily lysophospholipase [Chitinivorax tropicus]|uniref:Alpha-beta hydrolase superfamily lysophospholipase n=2 Tax=Chitinivorax tropicus TaxID=714531 RepID=A0A840MPP8_9PROT|nr:alpha-beta hydrolase superfamily lysophospholipase [Chitinivorax tropicus]
MTQILAAPDGHSIFMISWLPDDAPLVGILQISHGMAEHCLRYKALASHLSRHGIGVCTHDHRGHGRSVQGDEAFGHYADRDGWAKVVADLHQVNQHIHQAHPGVPIMMLGHSMGSFIQRAYLLQHGNTLQGAIISSTGIHYGIVAKLAGAVAKWDARRIGLRTPSKLMAKLSFGAFNLQFMPSRTAFDWLSRDPAQVDAYLADPFCGFDCSGGLWGDLFEAITLMEHAEATGLGIPTQLPVLFIAGGRDPVSMGGRGCKALRKRYVKAGMQDVDCRIYPGGRHEILNEINRETVYADITTWMLAHLASKQNSAPSTAKLVNA